MAVNQVDAALALPAKEAGAALLALPEDQWFDRASVRVLPKDLGAPLAAFANAEGGVIVIGLHDGRVEGCSQHPELRVGDETRKLSYPQREELEFDKGQAQYDGLPCPGVTMGDLDTLFLEDYRQSVRASSAASLIRARNLLTHSGELTNAAYLLFGQRPQDMFPEAHVRIIRLVTTERSIGARLGFEEGADQRVDGPIPQCINAAITVIDELLVPTGPVPCLDGLGRRLLFRARRGSKDW